MNDLEKENKLLREALLKFIEPETYYVTAQTIEFARKALAYGTTSRHNNEIG